MKFGVRQIVRSATGRARSQARNAMHWVSGRPAASAALLTRRLSPESQDGLWDLHYFLKRAKKHGLPVALIASLFVGTTIALNHLLGLHVNPGDPMSGAAIGVLGTVVTFFAVSTLAVSVSLTLLQTAAHMWPARIMDSIFTKDPDRKFLLQTICMAFLVSLVNLALLTAGLVHPLLALWWPVWLAFLTLMLMVAYVFDRVPLFSSAGLIKEITRRFEHQFTLLGDGHSENPQRARLEAMERVRDIFEVALALAKDERGQDAYAALKQGFELMEWLLEKQAAPGLQDRLGAGPAERFDWRDRLSIALYRADSACARVAAIKGGGGVRVVYNFFVNWMLQILSGIALVDLGRAYFDARRAIKPHPMEEMYTLGLLARALLKDSQNTDADDNPEKTELLKDVALYVLRTARDLSKLDGGAPGGKGGPVNAIGWVRKCFSPDVLARPEFSELSSWLAKMEASLSVEQSARLKKRWRWPSASEAETN